MRTLSIVFILSIILFSSFVMAQVGGTPGMIIPYAIRIENIDIAPGLLISIFLNSEDPPLDFYIHPKFVKYTMEIFKFILRHHDYKNGIWAEVVYCDTLDCVLLLP